jgi:hypothetical protein
MKQYHPLTNVAAIIAMLVVIMLSSLTGTAGHAQSADSPEYTSTETVQIDTPRVNSPIENLKKVFMIGKEVGNPETLQAIMLQESGGASGVRSNMGSHGLMQVQVVAARSVLQRFPPLLEQYFPERSYSTITNKEIIALLRTNDDANIRIAAYHFKLYLQLCRGNWAKAVASYNLGIGGAQNIENPSEFGYVRSIKARMNGAIRKFNLKHELTQQE